MPGHTLRRLAAIGLAAALTWAATARTRAQDSPPPDPAPAPGAADKKQAPDPVEAPGPADARKKPAPPAGEAPKPDPAAPAGIDPKAIEFLQGVWKHYGELKSYQQNAKVEQSIEATGFDPAGLAKSDIEEILRAQGSKADQKLFWKEPNKFRMVSSGGVAEIVTYDGNRLHRVRVNSEWTRSSLEAKDLLEAEGVLAVTLSPHLILLEKLAIEDLKSRFSAIRLGPESDLPGGKAQELELETLASGETPTTSSRVWILKDTHRFAKMSVTPSYGAALGAAQTAVRFTVTIEDAIENGPIDEKLFQEASESELPMSELKYASRSSPSSLTSRSFHGNEGGALAPGAVFPELAGRSIDNAKLEPDRLQGKWRLVAAVHFGRDGAGAAVTALQSVVRENSKKGVLGAVLIPKDQAGRLMSYARDGKLGFEVLLVEEWPPAAVTGAVEDQPEGAPPAIGMYLVGPDDKVRAGFGSFVPARVLRRCVRTAMAPKPAPPKPKPAVPAPEKPPAAPPPGGKSAENTPPAPAPGTTPPTPAPQPPQEPPKDGDPQDAGNPAEAMDGRERGAPGAAGGGSGDGR